MRATTDFRQRRRVVQWLAAMTGGFTLHGCGGGVDAADDGQDGAGPLATDRSAAAAVEDVDCGVMRYRVTDLGALAGFPSSAGHAVSASGHATGFAAGNDGLRAFLAFRGPMRDLGTLGGTVSIGYDVNDSGQVTGLSHDDGFIERAFLYSDGVMRRIGPFDWRHSVGYALNARADVTGAAEVGPAPRHAFLLRSDGQALDLGTLGGLQSAGYDINDAGQIAGTSEVADTNFEHAFLYADGAMQDLGTFGGNASAARAINVHGHVAGWADTAAPRTHAFIYSGGLMKDLDVFDGPYSEAHGINAADWVVGLAVLPGHSVPRGFVHDGTTLRDLNDLLVDGDRWEVIEAMDINDAGHIVGTARSRGSARLAHAVLLTPLLRC